MSSMMVQLRINTKSPLYQWVRQMEDGGKNVSQSIRTALESQLSQDMASTYQPEYKAHMLHAKYWRSVKKYHTLQDGRMNNQWQGIWEYVYQDVGTLES